MVRSSEDSGLFLGLYLRWPRLIFRFWVGSGFGFVGVFREIPTAAVFRLVGSGGGYGLSPSLPASATDYVCDRVGK